MNKKKKLKDLTDQELDSFCDKYNCDNCPLGMNEYEPFGCYALYMELYGEMEVKVYYD